MGKTLDSKIKIIKDAYFNLNSPSAYAGVKKILDEARKKDDTIISKDVENFLMNEKTYTLYKPVRKRFQRLKTIPSGLHTDWQCDLAIFDKLKDKNDGYMYLLVCIDVLSRKIVVAPARTKKSDDMVIAFDKIFEKSKVKPHKLYSDSGVEFQAKKMLEYYQKKDIIKHVMYTPSMHAGVVSLI